MGKTDKEKYMILSEKDITDCIQAIGTKGRERKQKSSGNRWEDNGRRKEEMLVLENSELSGSGNSIVLQGSEEESGWQASE